MAVVALQKPELFNSWEQFTSIKYNRPQKRYKCTGCGYVTGIRTLFCPGCGSLNVKVDGTDETL